MLNKWWLVKKQQIFTSLCGVQFHPHFHFQERRFRRSRYLRWSPQPVSFERFLLVGFIRHDSRELFRCRFLLPKLYLLRQCRLHNSSKRQLLWMEINVFGSFKKLRYVWPPNISVWFIVKIVIRSTWRWKNGWWKRNIFSPAYVVCNTINISAFVSSNACVSACEGVHSRNALNVFFWFFWHHVH